ncbi:MAG: Crp/Fnr family transcriptional regulator [Pyrinomonadaceae bacterium]
MAMKEYPLEFPKGQHGNCRTLTELTADHLPRNVALPDGCDVIVATQTCGSRMTVKIASFLQSGQVAVLVGDAEGREIVLRLIEPGEPFGELCFAASISSGKRSRAHRSSEAIEVDIADFMSYLPERSQCTGGFVFTFCMRLSDAERRIEFLAYRGAEERLGRLLLHLAATERSDW